MIKSTYLSPKNKLTPALFWHSVNILITKPHVVNKRLWGCKIWLRLYCKPVNTSNWELPAQFSRLESTVTAENVDAYMNKVLVEAEVSIYSSEDAKVEFILAELYPKKYSQTQVFQVIVINKENLSISFHDVSNEIYNHRLCPNFPFTLKLEENSIELGACCEEDEKSYTWLSTTLLHQVVKWCEETSNGSYNQSLCKQSLALVPQDKYYSKYLKLKEKYGKEMVKIWPECTDPSKFVYEDIAIATYLLLLWEDEEMCQGRKQRFVDLGCGNGLLVYILTKEGHTGVGIDVRKRNIWDMYTKDVILEEKTIVPSDSCLFPDTDWLIGNHSDELTPWIPVIAAKSSYACNFFLLPCCAYNFDGSKYQRKNSFKSQYTDFLEHIKELIEQCGFNVEVDRLKIPSTKRICLVSKGRNYTKENYEEYCIKIKDLITNNTRSKFANETWVKDFKARDPVERVRNCTQIDENLIGSIVECISSFLLGGSSRETTWYGGRTVDLGELIQLIPQDQLKQLKSECGGIQTLLKNNHNIFKVQSGKVQLRYPQTVDEVYRKSKSGNLKIKQKPCWFYINHPQGCPLLDSKCSFLHVKG
ncbi:Uncharacterized protein OBRU01_15069 [Operophtera brumata]|uniref:tRNA (uracil-O(2)-)-methyltransferase n=1 Tax=Operophtera brumata TaxID=104452 RepID=A0A0L7L501_OPEBR|nr:Uncharacterized protein OBRU01_15069 [Operophtera brumata]